MATTFGRPKAGAIWEAMRVTRVRPACLLDWVYGVRAANDLNHYMSRYQAIENLYRAEWRKRSYKRSP